MQRILAVLQVMSRLIKAVTGTKKQKRNMKQKIIYRQLLILIFIAILSCSKKNEPEADIFLKKGFEGAKKKNFETCIYNLSLIDEKFPYSSHSKKSEPVLIYCHYMQKNFETVHTMTESYESLYPNSESLPYLYYLRAISYYRVFKNYKKSSENLDKLILMVKLLNQIAPESEYAENLNKLLPFIGEVQDKHTLYVVQNYIKTQNYIAAVGRLSELYDTTLDEETKKMTEKMMQEILINFGVKSL